MVYTSDDPRAQAKYRALYQPLYNKRAAIVKGEVDVEATPEEGEEEEAGEEVPAGIPEFWQGKQLIEYPVHVLHSHIHINTTALLHESPRSLDCAYSRR